MITIVEVPNIAATPLFAFYNISNIHCIRRQGECVSIGLSLQKPYNRELKKVSCGADQIQEPHKTFGRPLIVARVWK